MNRNAILEVLRTIDDPEMPISIVDLGLVERVGFRQPSCVEVDLLPTFIGCTALPMIEKEVREKLNRLEGVGGVEVRFLNHPPWSVDRISEEGRASLKAFGITVPARPEAGISGAANLGRSGVVTLGTPEPIGCPFCDSTEFQRESSFGSTRCRMIYYCNACKNSFEHMKRF